METTDTLRKYRVLDVSEPLNLKWDQSLNPLCDLMTDKQALDFSFTLIL